MWKCKECGAEVVAVITGFAEIDKNAKTLKNTVKERTIKKYICDCKEYSKYDFDKKLRKIAEWVEE